MIAGSTQTVAAHAPGAELTLPALDLRALARRATVPALLAVAAVAAALIARGHVHAVTDGLRGILHLSPGWAVGAVVSECASLAGYVCLLSFVAGRAAPRVGLRESAQITLAGAAATRLLPTAGAGGLALAVWALRQAGLRSRAATRTLLTFLVLLYSVFLASIVLAGGLLALRLVRSAGPVELSGVAALVAALVIALCVTLAMRGAAPAHQQRQRTDLDARKRTAAIIAGAALVGDGVRDAVRLIGTRDLRLGGAIMYWAFDAAVLWALLHAVGATPIVPVVVLAYFVGQVANTLPIPGSVSGGIAGVLIAFGVAPALAVPAVLGYRAIAVWMPTPAALAALPALRATITRWHNEPSASSTA